MQKIREILQRINRLIIRELLIKLIIIVPLFGIVFGYIFNLEVIGEALKLYIINYMQPTKYSLEFANDISGILSGLILFLAFVTVILTGFFIMAFRASWHDFWKLGRRVFRAVYLALFIITFALILIFVALYLTGVNNSDSPFISFVADIFSGLGTETFGVFFVFLLFDVFMKTWEENEEAEYAEQRNQSKETQEQLELILARWHQTQADYLQQAKQASEKSIFNRLLSPQQMPSAYYEGQAQALDSVIRDIQNLIAEPNTPPSDLVADEVK